MEPTESPATWRCPADTLGPGQTATFDLRVRGRTARGFQAKCKVSTWLLAIARHKTISAIRRRSEAQLDETHAANIEDPGDDPETAVAKKDRSALLVIDVRRLQQLVEEVRASA